jgi:hypothetical protein
MSTDLHTSVTDLVAALHQSHCQYALAITGGGSGVVGRLLSVPGGSGTVLEAVVPYGESALSEYLAFRPASFCSIGTSQELARRACERARHLAPGSSVLGLGCTASLRSDRPKRGEHRCHISTRTARETRTWSLTLTKGARSRAEEEGVVELLILNALADGLGLAQRVSVPLLAGEEVVTETLPRGDPLSAFLHGRVARLRVDPDGRMRTDAAPSSLVLPGSFNPLHEAHLRLAQTAAALEKTEAAFELSVVNVDKPALADDEVRKRLAQFAWRAPVWLTRAPTFIEKGRVFPGATFVVGADTAARIVAPRYYKNQAGMNAVFDEFRALKCRFLVAGRVGDSGTFVGLDQVAIPEVYRDLFREIHFRCDISSTQLRDRSGDVSSELDA